MQGAGQVTGQIGFGAVRLDRFGSVVVLVLAHPPVNTLTAALVQGLMQALDFVAADGSVSAVILRGEGRGFSAGADVREIGQGASRGALAALCRRVEGFDRPVIAAVHGSVLGGGMELALAAHYRIASASAVLGLPEVGLGLLPGSGTTQRLPRLIGAAAALRLLLSGLPLRAPEALAAGLVDRVVSDNLGEAALAMALEGLPPRPAAGVTAGLRDMTAYQAAIAAARAEDRGNPLPAAGRIIECVEAAALLPYEAGLVAEAAAFEDLAATPQAQALCHAFQAERQALRLPPETAGQALPALVSIGIWGAGEPAFDLAAQGLRAGLRVTVCDPDRAALSVTLGRIAAAQEEEVARGHMTEEARDADWARLSSGLSAAVLGGADLILTQAQPFAPGWPQDVPVARMGAVLQGVGMTIPQGPGGLAELAIGAGATVPQILTLCALARRLQWRAVTVGPGGPVELGLRLALEAALHHLEAAGHPPATLAAALEAFGVDMTRPHLPPMPKGGMALVQVCLAALAAEGARMLSDGRARRPADIDAVALISGLMPRWQGGPMYQADRRGLLVLRADLRKLPGEVFQTAPVLDDLIAEGQKFASLNAD